MISNCNCNQCDKKEQVAQYVLYLLADGETYTFCSRECFQDFLEEKEIIDSYPSGGEIITEGE